MADKDDKDDDIPKVVPNDEKIVTKDELLDAAKEIIEAVVKKADEHRNKQLSGNLGPGGWVDHSGIPDEDEIREDLSWIPGRFEEFLKPDPADLDDVIEPAKKVAEQFGYQGESLLTETAHGTALDRAWYMSLKWKGVMADAFNEEFLEPMMTIMPNQGRLATVLHAEAEKAKEVYKLQRKNALKVAEDTVKAIEAIKKSKGEDWNILIAALITAGTFMTLGSGSLAFSGAAVIGGATMGGPFVPDDDEGEDLPLAADTGEEVIDNMKEALNAIEKSVEEEEDQLIKAMKENEAMVRPEVGEATKGTLLIPMKPELTGADADAIKRRFVKFDGDGGGGGDDDGGGRGSYMGDDPPKDFDGSVHDTGKD